MTLLPAASFPCSVAVTVFPEETVAAETVTRDVETEILPGTTVTVGKLVETLTPLTVALIVVGVPETIPVKDAEYVPFKLSVTAPKFPVEVPPLRLNTTVEPPPLKAFPAASRAVKVTVMLLPDATDAFETAIVEFPGEIIPGVTVTVGLPEVTAEPAMVAVIFVAVPARTPVKIAE